MTFVQVYHHIINRKLLNNKEHFRAYFTAEKMLPKTKHSGRKLWLIFLLNYLLRSRYTSAKICMFETFITI